MDLLGIPGDVWAVLLALAVFAGLFALVEGLDRHMSAIDAISLAISALLLVYLVYALIRGEKL